jgi:FtsP/CotA-like multicopper oxidase with cupredoxin domain
MSRSSGVSRRDFLRVAAVGGTATAGLVVVGRVAGRYFETAAAAEMLNPAGVPKYATPLLIPPVMPRAGTMNMPGGKPVDLYEIAMRQFTQQVLPAPMPRTTVWGYGPLRSSSRNAPMIFNAPSLTIEAQVNRPVRVRWVNQLVDPSGRYLPHLLPVDPTLHWANPPGGTMMRDQRPGFGATPGPYSGPVPIVTHVHGATNVGDESDGYAEAWFLPAATDIPSGYATEGTWYEFFKQKAAAKFGVTWTPGSAVFQYPNDDRAGTKWYHDHTLGMTRLNVYAGPAGFYIVRGGPAGDKAVVDTRTGGVAVLPGPAPREGDRGNKTYREVPLAIQDRTFNADGSLFYPDSRSFFDGVEGPYIPDSDISPFWNPEFFGNTIIVNGNTWPTHRVEQCRYRYRVLNGCQSRFLILHVGHIPGISIWQIGNEGGFLSAPVDLMATSGGQVLLGPAERADLVVDFTDVPLGNHVLRNVGPDEPFGGGVPGVDFPSADPATTGQVMQFTVVPAVAPDTTTPPQFLGLPAVAPLPAPAKVRPLALLEEMSMDVPDAPAETLLGTVEGTPAVAPGTWVKQMWSDTTTEAPAAGTVEDWEFYNATADAHPIHVHDVLFQVLDRQAIIVDEANQTVQVDAASPPVPPEPWETGFKETVIAYPGQVTRIRSRFGGPGQFVWHCHIVEHEDNEMMRPYRIGPLQTGQPRV